MSLYKAAVIPKKRAIGTAIKVVMAAKNNVLYNLWSSKSTTVRDLSIPEAFRPENELPKSPVKAFPIQFKYLMYAGWSKPSSRRKAATVSLVALCPRIASPKSPGSNSIEPKIRIDTTIKVIKPRKTLCKTVKNTGCNVNPFSVNFLLIKPI